jgi:hypothetical protein
LSFLLCLLDYELGTLSVLLRNLLLLDGGSELFTEAGGEKVEGDVD